MNENLKCCAICGEVKLFREFGINRLSGTRSSVCRDCEKKLKKEINRSKAEDKRNISPKTEALIYDMRQRLKDLNLNVADILEITAPVLSDSSVYNILSKTLISEPKLAALETVCDALDLELMLYVIPRTTPRYHHEETPREEIDPDARKECASCGRILPMSEFTKNRNEKDGYTRYCKDCMREKMIKSKQNKEDNQ